VSGPLRYSEEIPTAPGYYVYRFWTADGTCLYVGRVGDSGPRSPQARLNNHRYTKTWWPDVAKIEVAELPDHPAVVAEEAEQIKALRPLHNVRRANCGHDLSLPGAVKSTGGCRECAKEYSKEYNKQHYDGTAQAAYEASPARKAAKREYDRKRQPRHNALKRLRRRRPPAGQAPLWE
jgi:hypothetical protein